MKIYKLCILIFAIAAGLSCGIKSPPIPKSSLNIPYPDAIRVTVKDDGILIENLNQKYTMLAERSEISKNFASGDIFKRLSFVSPNSSYLDKNVKRDVSYIYRFRNFYPEYNTYSPAVTRTLKYYVPVSVKNVIISQEDRKICIKADLSAATNYISVNINGKEAGNIKLGSECFDLPNSLVVGILLIPYDFEGNPGTPYNENIKQNETMVLLPPQNAKALREGANIILSWDKAGKIDDFLIYVRDEQNQLRLLEKTNITIYKYLNASKENCSEFEISASRDGKESDRIKISSCP